LGGRPKDLENSSDLKARVAGIKSLVVWVGDKGDFQDQETIMANRELISMFAKALKISSHCILIKPLTWAIKDTVLHKWKVQSVLVSNTQSFIVRLRTCMSTENQPVKRNIAWDFRSSGASCKEDYQIRCVGFAEVCRSCSETSEPI